MNSELISIVAIVVASVTALSIAHGQKKQARQIEAFRRDASVGLVPPPTALWTHLTKYWGVWLNLLCMGVQTASLVSLLRSSQSLSLDTLVELSVVGGSLFVTLVMGVMTFVQVQITDILKHQNNILEHQKTILENQKEVWEHLGKLTSRIDKRFESLNLTRQLDTSRKIAEDTR